MAMSQCLYIKFILQFICSISIYLMHVFLNITITVFLQNVILSVALFVQYFSIFAIFFSGVCQYVCIATYLQYFSISAAFVLDISVADFLQYFSIFDVNQLWYFCSISVESAAVFLLHIYHRFREA